MNPAIETSGLTKRYGIRTALNDVTIKIGAQKIVGLIGRNGAGKTTFLKICAGLLRPTAGELRVWSERPFDNMKALSQLVFIGEETNYDEGLKLIDLFGLGSIYYAGWDQALAEKLLQCFEFSPNLKYKSLSLGMKTQFKLIMGFCSRAPLVLFDEPTLGLDMAVRKEFYHVLISDYSEHPRTFILSSHLPDEVENLIEEVVILKEGSLVLQKPVVELADYALGLHGKKEDVNDIIQNCDLLHREYFGNNVSAIIINNLQTQDFNKLAARNIQISKVAFQDLCIYLTQNWKEGPWDEKNAEY